MTTYMRESDNVEMLEVRPCEFVNARFINGTDIFDEHAADHIADPNLVELHRIAKQIRDYNAIHGEI